MFEEIITRFQQRKISLQIDPLLQKQIATKYRNSPIELSFSLFDFAYAIGTCRSVAPTKANKFSLALDFLEILVRNNANELRILISDSESTEQKQDISKYAGEGLSLIIAEKLYNLRRSTITRIRRRGNESKPDFMGFNPPLKVVWEAKGSTDIIGQDEINHAKNQKANETADIAFASLAALKSESITEVYLEDPPTLPLDGDALRQQLSRVMHYVNIFNFIGQPRLSRYFALLGKRLERDRRFPEYKEKEQLFEEIRFKSIRLSIKEWDFLGNIERIGDSTFFYVGFDERLLSVQNFLGFMDYEEDFIFKQDKNTFAISRDGICYGYLRDLSELRNLGFAREINVQEISFYRDTLSIRDLDYMLDFQLAEHIKYLFAREGFEVRRELLDGNKRFDLIVIKEGKVYVVEVKKDVVIKTFEQLKGRGDVSAALLITTMRISDEDIRYARNLNIIIIDRRALKAIIRNKESISGLLSKLPM